MFRVDYDARANRITIHVSGFWTLDAIPPFAAAVAAKVRAVAALRNDWDVLVESLDFPVQANDVADVLPAIMRDGMPLTSGRAAVVVGSQLNRMQAERTLIHPRVKVFLSVADADVWLTGASEQAA